MTLKCWGKVDYNIEWDGTPDDLVKYMDLLSMQFNGEPLDSADLGDAMGFIMKMLDQQGRFTWELKGYGKLVAEKNYEPFVWEGLPEKNNDTCLGA